MARRKHQPGRQPDGVLSLRQHNELIALRRTVRLRIELLVYVAFQEARHAPMDPLLAEACTELVRDVAAAGARYRAILNRATQRPVRW